MNCQKMNSFGKIQFLSFPMSGRTSLQLNKCESYGSLNNLQKIIILIKISNFQKFTKFVHPCCILFRMAKYICNNYLALLVILCVHILALKRKKSFNVLLPLDLGQLWVEGCVDCQKFFSGGVDCQKKISPPLPLPSMMVCMAVMKGSSRKFQLKSLQRVETRSSARRDGLQVFALCVLANFNALTQLNKPTCSFMLHIIVTRAKKGNKA